MERYKSIDSKIQEGYVRIQRRDNLIGCDRWLEAWAEIKNLLSESMAEDLGDLEEKYDWTEFISNYVQDMEMELHNAGLVDKAYHLKRAIYCEELLERCNDDEMLVSNTRRGMAEGYYNYGDKAKCDELYTDWLRDDPDWGWGYVGWSDCYCRGSKNTQYARAEEILLAGYARIGLRDKIAVVERLASLYGYIDKPEKAEEYDKIFSAMQRSVPRNSPYYDSTVAVKVGRNEPCPCGSGKKYKKCCGF
jgi:hypothetical protein